MLYLMIEHNNDKYLKFIKILYKLKICFCLNCLMQDTLQSIISKELEIFVDNKSQENTIHTKDASIKLEHSTYEDQSMQTQTIAQLHQL